MSQSAVFPNPAGSATRPYLKFAQIRAICGRLGLDPCPSVVEDGSGVRVVALPSPSRGSGGPPALLRSYGATAFAFGEGWWTLLDSNQ